MADVDLKPDWSVHSSGTILYWPVNHFCFLSFFGAKARAAFICYYSIDGYRFEYT